MSRPLAILFALALFVPPAPSAPKLKDGEKTNLYFPTTVGTRRVIEMTMGGRSTETTEVVTAVEEKDGMTVVSVGRELDKRVVPFFQYGVSDKGLFRVTLYEGDRPRKSAACLLRLPATPGDTWEEESPARAISKTKYTTGKEEELEVPAGKFRAVRVEVVTKLTADRTLHQTFWYAPGVGSVEIVTNDGGIDRVTVLKSFTPGKK
jgi:hypothetical protein